MHRRLLVAALVSALAMPHAALAATGDDASRETPASSAPTRTLQAAALQELARVTEVRARLAMQQTSRQRDSGLGRRIALGALIGAGAGLGASAAVLWQGNSLDASQYVVLWGAIGAGVGAGIGAAVSALGR